jgi:hypothetical protein
MDAAETTFDHVARMGVTEHELERLFAGGEGSGGISVSRLFEEAAKEGIPVTALVPGTSPPVDLAISDRARARVTEELAAGKIVILPEQAVALDGESLSGWWLVDLATGEVTDRLEDGRSFATMSPLAVTLGNVVKSAPAVKRMGVCTVARYVMAAAVLTTVFGLGLATGGIAGNSAVAAIAGAGLALAGAGGAGAAGWIGDAAGCF